MSNSFPFHLRVNGACVNLGRFSSSGNDKPVWGGPSVGCPTAAALVRDAYSRFGGKLRREWVSGVGLTSELKAKPSQTPPAPPCFRFLLQRSKMDELRLEWEHGNVKRGSTSP